MAMITTGRITTRKRARVHLAIDDQIVDNARKIGYKTRNPHLESTGSL